MENSRLHRYVPALDGLRAIAVGAVMAYHLGYGWAAGGYLGVDLFFVLSGYLITGLLVDEWQRTGGIDLRAFWMRRARRLLPGLLLVLAALSVYAALRRPGFDGQGFRGDSLATALYVANWHQIFAHHSYFQQFAAASPLRHTWSLAIEEQFYLVWPLALAAVLGPLAVRPAQRWDRRRCAFVLTVALAIGSVVLMARLFHPGVDPTRVYDGTDTRAFDPLVGAALALLTVGRLQRASRRDRFVWAAALAASAVLSYWAVTAAGPPAWMYRGGMFVVALLVAVVIAGVTHADPGPLGRLLSLRPLRYIGRISYGLYLWHWPVFVLSGDIGLSGVERVLCRVVITFALAVLSYHLLERPIREAQFAPRPGWILGFAAAAVVATAVIVPNSFGAAGPGAAGTGAATATGAATGRPVASILPVNGPTAGRSSGAAPTNPPASVLLVGDSTAMTLAEGLRARQGPFDLVVHDGAAIGCSIVGNYTADDVYGPRRQVLPLPGCDWSQLWPHLLGQYQPQVVLVLFGPWDTADHLVNGQWLMVGTVQWRAYYEARLTQMVNLLSSRGATVVLATAPRYHHDPNPGEPDPRFSDRSRVDALNGVYRAVAATHPAVVLDDISATVTPADLSDGVHFSAAGRLRLAAIVDPELSGIAYRAAARPSLHREA